MTGAISRDRQSCQSVFWWMKDALSYRSARPENGRNARDWVVMEPFARSPSERLRRLALASGFRLSDCLDSTRRGARWGAGRQAQMANDFDDHGRIFNRGDDFQGAAAAREAFDVDVENRLSNIKGNRIRSRFL